MRHVPEPDRDDWIARMRERARLDAEELVPRPGFGVFGLAEPKLRPAALAETSQVNGEWDSISLAYGDWEGADAPRVTVTTAARRASESAREAEAELLWALAQERNRIAAHADIDEDDPDEPPEYSRTEQSLGTERVAGLLGRQGNVWAARVEAHGRIVTIVGRGLEPASVRLEPVTDLAPYLQGRNQVLGRLVERQRLQPAPVLQPAEGVAAYRALAESELASQARLVEALEAGRPPRYKAREGAIRHALWQRAVREQARITGIAERQANEIVTLVVNHLTQLQEKAPWFTAVPALREAAIDETLRYSVLGEAVASKPAQQAWARCWAYQMSAAGLDELEAGPPARGAGGAPAGGPRGAGLTRGAPRRGGRGGPRRGGPRGT
jgi:hypothetical protein